MPTSSQPSGEPIRESFDEFWDFAKGDLVPGWFEHAEGVSRMTFTVDVTIFKDLHGGYWVMPATPTEFPIHAVGYGSDTPVRIHGQGRGGVRVLNRPPIDVMAYLQMTR